MVPKVLPFFQIRSLLGLVHTVYLLVKSFKTDEFAIDTQRTFSARFMLSCNDAVPDKISNPLQYRFSIRNSIIPT